MELNDLKPIAEKLFQIMQQEDFLSKDASDIEVAAQVLVNQLSGVLMQDFVLPARIKQVHSQVAAGSLRCQNCNQKLQLHKQDQPIHLQTIFGKEIGLSRHQHSCPDCHTYSYVADSQLGLIGRKMTPRLALIVALCGASWSYAVASAFLDFLPGVEVSTKTVELVTEDERVKQQVLHQEPLDQPPGATGMEGVLIKGRLKDQRLEKKISHRTGQAYKHNPPKEKHREALTNYLESGEVAEAISYIGKHNPRKGWKKEAARKLINYLRRHQSHIPNYEQIKAAGGTVSSGLIEKGNDLIVVRRMKEGQMHWTREGAAPVINHRTRFINRGAKTRTGPYDLAFCRQTVQ